MISRKPEIISSLSSRSVLRSGTMTPHMPMKSPSPRKPADIDRREEERRGPVIKCYNAAAAAARDAMPEKSSSAMAACDATQLPPTHGTLDRASQSGAVS